MLVYTVLSSPSKVEPIFELSQKYNLKGNNLVSYYYVKDSSLINLLKKISNNILIDSGAFTLFSSKKKHDFEEYFNNYLNYIKKHTSNDLIKGFFELDIDSIIGYDEVLSLREKLTNVSDKIIPVYHKRLGVEEFKKMVAEYDYVSVGGIVSKEIHPSELPPFVKYAHKHNTKIHALGITSPKYLKKIPFDSVDSSSVISSRFGRVLFFKNGKMNSIKLDSEYISKNYAKMDTMSYLSFLKFEKYYENYWKNYRGKI